MIKLKDKLREIKEFYLVNHNKERNKLLAVFDLEKIHAGYDIVGFLHLLVNFLIKKKIKSADLCIVGGKNKGFKKHQIKTESFDYANSQLYNSIIPSITMCKKVDNFFYLKKRNEFYQIKKNYKFFFPEGFYLGMLKNEHNKLIKYKNFSKKKNNWLNIPSLYLKKVKNYKLEKNNKPLVTITLRESFKNSWKNSNLKVWKSILKVLNKKFTPIIIRDFDKVKKKDFFYKYEIVPEASYNLFIRAAIYQYSKYNLFTNGGQCEIMRFNSKTRYTSFLKNKDKLLSKKNNSKKYKGFYEDINNKVFDLKNELKDENIKEIKKAINKI